MRISVLGIGTELTSGQILNRNGQWISQKLRDLGLPSVAHLVVPDDRALILSALQFCTQQSDLIFVTGGLGPTSDDFTREVIAQGCGQKLIWHEPSWKAIREKLNSRGITVKELQKQQCYFPEKAEILLNRLGTANGFFINHEGKEIFVLPGPPKEIEGLWEDSIFQRMKEKASRLDPVITRSWDTLGRGESDIAELVEPVLVGCSFDKGYRVHLPFVEFKISYLKSQSTEAQTKMEAIEKAIGSLTVLRDGDDAAQKLALLLQGYSKILIHDELPGSTVIHRLLPFCKPLLKNRKLNFISDSRILKTDSRDLVLSLKESSPNCCRVSIQHQGQTRWDLFRDRQPFYFSEMAMIFWLRQLS